MYAAAMIRDLTIDQLRRTQLSVRNILEGCPRESLTSYRDGGKGWTVTEIVCHLRDFESVFLERARLTSRIERPDLPFPDPDQLAIDHHYAQEEAWQSFEDWVRRRRALLEFFESLDGDTWERAANHPTRGRFTLNQQLMLAAWHDVNHIEQISRILAEKR